LLEFSSPHVVLSLCFLLMNLSGVPHLPCLPAQLRCRDPSPPHLRGVFPRVSGSPPFILYFSPFLCFFARSKFFFLTGLFLDGPLTGPFQSVSRFLFWSPRRRHLFGLRPPWRLTFSSFTTVQHSLRSLCVYPDCNCDASHAVDFPSLNFFFVHPSFFPSFPQR